CSRIGAEAPSSSPAAAHDHDRDRGGRRNRASSAVPPHLALPPTPPYVPSAHLQRSSSYLRFATAPPAGCVVAIAHALAYLEIRRGCFRSP
uniref:Uncharacterized protein n=2 Tax=Oryza TaxID=4527 RepID=A0A0E0FQ43_ORYNI